MSLSLSLVDAVLAGLELDRPPRADLEALGRIYRAWCGAIPFDSVRKMIHVAAGRRGRLPGSTAADFFRGWLADGAGGTCWAGNGALHDLLAALGYRTRRVAATMMVRPDTPGPNHGSVLVDLPEGRHLVDASVLSVVPLRVPDRDEPGDPGELTSSDLPRLEWRPGRAAGHLVLVWRTRTHPGGLDCRIDRIGLGAGEWDAHHQRTGVWSPFNYVLSASLVRGGRTVGYGGGMRFTLDARGELATWPAEGAKRTRFLVEELGLAPALAAEVPPDREVPPAPPDFHPPTSAPPE